MRFVLTILLIALLAAVAAWFLPWWSMALLAFLVAMLTKLRPAKGFLAGFLGLSLLWLVAVLMKDIPNEHILSSKMAVLFFKQPNYVLFIAVNVFLGGLIGGMSAWGGSLLRRAFAK